MLETALIVLLITVFFAAVFFLLPEGWRWLAARNVRRRRLLEREAVAHYRALRQAAGRLRPYRDLQASIYQERYAAARRRVARADELRQESARHLERVALPRPPAGSWSFVHFLQHPRQLILISRDAYYLWQLGRCLRAGGAALAAAKTGLARLEQTPADLLERCRALAEERLPRLGNDLRAESQEGMTALSDMATRLQHLKQRAMALERELAAGLQGGAPPAAESLAAADGRAQLLEELAAAADALEADLQAVRAERRALDQALEAAVEARSQLPPVEEQPELNPPLARADDRLAEAAALRSERAFAEAGKRAQDARTLIDTAAVMARALTEGKAAAARAKFALDPAPYGELGRRLEEAVAAAHHLGEPMVGREGEGSGRGEMAAVDEDAAADLRRRFDDLAAEARRLREVYEEDRRRLQEEADRQAIRLRQARRVLESKLSLSPSEPLLARARDVLASQEAATGRPAPLRAFIEDATALAAALEEAATEVDARLNELETQREALSERLARAEQQAAQWRSLHPHVEVMRECAAGLWQIGPHADKLATVYGDLADGRALYARALETYEALKADRQRLSTLERRIDLVRGRLENHADDFDPATLQRVTGLADDYVTEARRAATVEDAAAALDEAYDVLKDLAAG